MSDEATFELFFSHGQIVVHDPALANPFNAWTSRHEAQGFACRLDTVTFATPEGGGDLRVIVRRGSLRADELTAATRVPSAAGANIVPLASGTYELTFAFTGTEGEDNMSCVLAFTPAPASEPRIIKADPGLTLAPGEPFLMTAEPAG